MPPAFDDGSAEYRTRLANERTYLAWWRTAIAAFAVGLGAGKVAPNLSGGAHWPFVVLGVGFALLGIVCAGYAYVRQHAVSAAMDRGEFVSPDERAAAVLSGCAILLGLLLLGLLLS
jgi:putative membrane protein